MSRVINLTILICLLAAALPCFAQNIYTGNPADPAMLEAAFTNPALNATIKDRLAFTLTSHHVGLAGGFMSIRSGLVSYHMPWRARGLALAAQFLRVGLYSQSDFRVSYGRRVYGPVSAGVNLDVFNRGMNRADFFHVDPRDPLLQGDLSKTGIGLGLGAAVQIHRSATLAAAADFINRPDLAVGSAPVYQPLLFSIGLKWYGNGFNLLSAMTSLPLRQVETGASRRRTLDLAPRYTHAAAEAYISRGILRMQIDGNAAQMEAEAPLYGDLYVNYRYGYYVSDINIASSGTHRFGFVFDFDRLPPPSALPAIPLLGPQPLRLPPLTVSPHGFYHVLADADSVKVTRLHVRRNFEPGVPQQSLALLLPDEIASAGPVTIPLDGDSTTSSAAQRLTGLYSNEYRGTLEGIGFQMRDPATSLQTEVVTFPGSEQRASALVNVMTGSGVAVQRDVPILTVEDSLVVRSRVTSPAAEETQQRIVPPHVTFRIVPILQTMPSAWWLEIFDSGARKVHEFAGFGVPPDSITWDWKLPSGSTVPAGAYTYLLRTSDANGHTMSSTRGEFAAVHLHQSLTIDVTRRPMVGDVPADKYILILSPDGVARRPAHSGQTLDAATPEGRP